MCKAKTGRWTDFELPESDTAESRIKLEIESIEIEDALVSAVPFVAPDANAVVKREPVLVDETDVNIEFFWRRCAGNLL